MAINNKDLNESEVVLSLKYNGIEHTIKFDHDDLTMEDYLNAFSALLIGATFYPETIYKGMVEYGEEMFEALPVKKQVKDDYPEEVEMEDQPHAVRKDVSEKNIGDYEHVKVLPDGKHQIVGTDIILEDLEEFPVEESRPFVPEPIHEIVTPTRPGYFRD